MSTSRLPIGKRMLPSVFDEWVALEPHRVVAALPKSAEMEDWNYITFAEYDELVNSFAWFIEQTLGRCETAEPAVISYIGVPDWRYPSFWVAAMKCGYCTLCPSIRNASAEHVALMRDTGCTKILYSTELATKAKSILELAAGDLDLIPVPSFAELQRRPESKVKFPWNKTFDQWADRRALCFHTSGTTGLPQPRFMTHAYFATMDNTSRLQPPLGRKQALWSVTEGDIFYHNYPSFHAGGCFLNLVLSLFVGAVPALQSHEAPLTPEGFVKASRALNPVAAFLVPSFLEDAAETPEAVEHLAKLKYLFFGAGPLTRKVGDWLAERTNLIQNFGSSETSMLPHLIQGDWTCVEWNPTYGIIMDEVEDGLFELIMRKDPSKAHLHAVFKVFPDITEWRTKDLFTRGELLPNTWRFYGRRDQVIALSNGEKVSPVLMERHIAEHPLVTACMVGGQGKMQTVLLVEPDHKKWDSARSADEFIEEIWPNIEQSNATTSATGQIFRNRIIVTKPGKSFVLVDKGTVSRARTLEHFSREIEEVYANNEDRAVVPLPEDINPTSMKAFVRKCLNVYVPADITDDTTDFFASNVDSLQTIGFVNVIRTSLKNALGSEPEGMANIAYRRMVYENPTVEKMAARLTTYINQIRQPNVELNGHHIDPQEERQARITSLVDKYTKDLDSQKVTLPPHTEQLTVVLTGQTGSLGSYLLYDLVSSARVDKVYCFNRRDGAKDLAVKDFLNHGRDTNLLKKADFFKVDFGAKDFGIDSSRAKEISDSTDIIIHNAWAVNFNHVLESFETPHIKGLRTFVNWSIESPKHPHLFFVSTIGTAAQYSEPGPVPEATFETCINAVPQGYAEGKHVSERILELSSEKTGFSFSILRLGQAGGPTTRTGLWNEREWFPILLKSSKTLGKVPDQLGGTFGDLVEWVPVDLAATTCVELAINARDNHHQEKQNVFHLVNPERSSWKQLVPVVKDFYTRRGTTMEIVSYKEWVKALHQALTDGLDLPPFNKIPALKLLEFFDSMQSAPQSPVFGTTKTRKKSPTLASLKAVQPALLELFLEQLNY